MKLTRTLWTLMGKLSRVDSTLMRIGSISKVRASFVPPNFLGKFRAYRPFSLLFSFRVETESHESEGTPCPSPEKASTTTYGCRGCCIIFLGTSALGFLHVLSSLGCSSHFFHNLHNSLIAISYALFSDLPASRFQTLSAIHIHSITRKTRGPYTSFSHPFTSRTACNVVIFRLQLRSVTCYTWLLCLSFTWAPSRCFISVTR